MLGSLKQQAGVDFDQMTQLAVYGTLKTGEANHEIMRRMMERNHAIRSPNLWYLPSMAVAAKTLPITGPFGDGDESNVIGLEAEMYQITGEALRVLKAFEGPYYPMTRVYAAPLSVPGRRQTVNAFIARIPRSRRAIPAIMRSHVRLFPEQERVVCSYFDQVNPPDSYMSLEFVRGTRNGKFYNDELSIALCRYLDAEMTLEESFLEYLDYEI